MDQKVVRIHKRLLESDAAGELHITAVPPAAPAEQQARAMFPAVAEALRAAGASIFQERVFGTAGALEAAEAIRAEAYGDLADAVRPARLLSGEGRHGPLAGVQVHAVCGRSRLRVLSADGSAWGRVLKLDGRRHVALSGLSAAGAGAGPAQARAMFELADRLLGQAGGGMHSVARTWLWLGDILSWYGQFNGVRSRFFAERGLIGATRGRFPASTGIGVRPAGGAACALDVMAVVGPADSIRCFQAAGRQRSAFAYGSAFSRAARAASPGGQTVFVSGTAAVDEAGATRHAGDARAQIQMTLANVRAVLTQQGCRDQDVVQAIAYCKTPEVEAIWRDGWADLPWPCVTVISDVCRDELLFELEAAACPGGRRV